MQMPTIYGSPSTKAFAGIASKSDLMTALRQNDQAALHGVKSWDDLDGADVGFGGFASVVPGIRLNRFSGINSYMKAGLKKVWATARACELVADQIAEVPLTFQRGETIEKRPNGDLVALLKNPNEYDTIADLFRALTFHLKITGHGYWVKDETNIYGQPKALYWLNPAFVSITPDPKRMIRRFTYRVNGRDIDFEPEEIIYFRRANPMNPALGLGEIERGETLYDEFINRALFKETFMENGGAPGSVLVNESWEGEDTTWEAMRSKFMERYGGLRNAGKQAWLNGKWSLLRLGLTAAEMQELETSRQNVEDIFHNHGVPLSVAGYPSANYATAEVEFRSFLALTVKPLFQSILDTLNHKNGLIPSYDKNLTLVGLIKGLIDVEKVVKQYSPLVELGAMTPNELRVMTGLPKAKNPYLDQYFVKSSLTPIEVSGIASETPVGVRNDNGTGTADANEPENDEETGNETTKPTKPGKKPKPGKDQVEV